MADPWTQEQQVTPSPFPSLLLPSLPPSSPTPSLFLFLTLSSPSPYLLHFLSSAPSLFLSPLLLLLPHSYLLLLLFITHFIIPLLFTWSHTLTPLRAHHVFIPARRSPLRQLS